MKSVLAPSGVSGQAPTHSRDQRGRLCVCVWERVSFACSEFAALERPYFEGLFAFCWAGRIFFLLSSLMLPAHREPSGVAFRTFTTAGENAAQPKKKHTPLQRNNAPLRVALCSMHMFAKRDSSRQWKGERRERKKRERLPTRKDQCGDRFAKKASKKCTIFSHHK